MRTEKDTQAYFSYRTAIFSIILGIVLFAGVFATCTVRERSRGRESMDEALEFMRQRCIQYDNMVATEEANAQIQLLDKTRELARCLNTGSVADWDDFLEQYALNQRLGGIMIIGPGLDVTFSAGGYDAKSSLWNDIITNENITNVMEYNQKYYMARLDDGDIHYDYAAVALENDAGYLICYQEVSDSDTGETTIAMENLFSGYKMEMDGLIIITDGDRIISSNDDSLQGMDVELYPLIAEHRAEISSDEIDYVSEDGVKYMANNSKCKSYYLYVFFPTSEVYGQRYVIMAYLIVLYVLYLLFAISLRQRELNRADQLKMKFLRQMSHDIRTPINGIRGMIRIADSCPDDMEKQKDCRRKIWEASGYLIDLVSDVLDMGKLESGEIKLADEPFEMTEMIDGIVSVFDNQAKDHHVTLEKGEIAVTHDNLIGSTVHIRRVLSNIITNAIKYNRTDGRVNISCRETNRTTEDGKIFFDIVCSDTGIGMSRDFQKHMFEQFTQENAVGELSHHGTGLGLPIVKSLVDKMGGTVTCKSKRGEGTTFYISIPFAVDDTKTAGETNSAKIKDSVNDTAAGTAEDNDAADNKTPSDESLTGIKILVVEDNDLNMEIAEFMLEDAGIIVTEAWNGQEAVEKFSAAEPGTFDMILMDMMMPVMDGLEATRAIRALPRDDAATIPIVAMTANVFEEDVNATKEAGMNAHLAKPIDEKQLRDTILEQTGKQS